MTVPSIQWCGEMHPHVAHTYARPAGLTGVYTQCPGAEQEIIGDLAARIARGVMEVVRAEVAAAGREGEERGAAKERERCAEELRPAFAGLAVRTPGWHDSETAAILRDLDKRWRSS